MAPFTSYATSAINDAPIDKKAAADTRSENDGKDNFFWQQLVEHPNYDEFWQRRSILPHLKDVKTNVMTVGGWFDAEDLYGPLHIYQPIEEKSPNAFNVLVMGPWSHGGWARAG